ncbi:putative inorganic phosphate transporter [Caldisericum exile AZM16c01]|uniref:Inorganic phosphate transporter n=2 Tax=Caldisericum exile TaxID=693075 RepID=A0A7U6GFE4_CALEA|nr:putative inorganic phosphate transporter [Caldisericum exile AZM16c01]
MDNLSFLVFLIVAGVFQILMGANDGGVLLGSIISSNVIHPLFGVILLFLSLTVAPLVFGTEVVKTLGTKIVPIQYITLPMLYGAIIGTMIWVIIAQRIKYPVSISYTFVGALVGSAIARKVHTQINTVEILKVFGGLIASIFIGLIVSYLLTKIFNLILRLLTPKASPFFKIFQVISSIFLVMGYGANDAEKTLSLVYTASMISGVNFAVNPKNIFVISLLSFLFIVGTLFFGANSLLTAGFRLMKSNPKETFLAQTITSATVLTFAQFGLPVSSTETLNMSVVGIGVAEKPYAVKFNVVRNLVLTWLVTVPMSILISYGVSTIFITILK